MKQPAKFADLTPAERRAAVLEMFADSDEKEQAELLSTAEKLLRQIKTPEGQAKAKKILDAILEEQEAARRA